MDQRSPGNASSDPPRRPPRCPASGDERSRRGMRLSLDGSAAHSQQWPLGVSRCLLQNLQVPRGEKHYGLSATSKKQHGAPLGKMQGERGRQPVHAELQRLASHVAAGPRGEERVTGWPRRVLQGCYGCGHGAATSPEAAVKETRPNSRATERGRDTVNEAPPPSSVSIFA